MISVPKVSPCLHVIRPACIWLVISPMCATDALCRRIDFLRLMSGHSISGRSTNDELRLQRGAAIIPLPSSPTRCNLSPGCERPRTAAPQSMHGFATINALISSFLVCSNDKRDPRESPVTLCKYCWCICSHLPLLPLALLFRAQIQISGHDSPVRCGASQPHGEFFQRRCRKRTARKWVAIKIGACQDVLSLADKTVIQCYA